MKKVNQFILISLVLSLISLCTFCKKSDQPGEHLTSKYGIELKFSFPGQNLEKEGIYLWGPRSIDSDASGNIYICDQRMNSVLIFNSEGKFINKFGRKGEGPGEFSSPQHLFVTKDYIVVNDVKRIQFFNKNGSYLSGFNEITGYYRPVLQNKDIVYALPLLQRLEMKLIDVLSMEGEVISSFGDSLEFKKGLFPLNYSNIAITDKCLYIAFQHFPIVRKYSLEGDLISEFKIDHEGMAKLEKTNLENYKAYLIQTSGRGIRLHPIIIGIRASQNRFYLLHIDQNIEILEYDTNGYLTTTYWCQRPEGYSASDFIVREERDILSFYLLQITPNNRIDKFSPLQ